MREIQEQVYQKSAFTFDGIAKIVLRATTTGVRKIVLHVKDLEISTYSLTNNVVFNTGLIPYDKSKYDSITDKWTINLDNNLPTDRATELTVNYKGFMRDDMKGLYRSFYMQDGIRKWMAATQLHKTEARTVFPCFDVSFHNFKVLLKSKSYKICFRSLDF